MLNQHCFASVESYFCLGLEGKVCHSLLLSGEYLQVRRFRDGMFAYPKSGDATGNHTQIKDHVKVIHTGLSS